MTPASDVSGRRPGDTVGLRGVAWHPPGSSGPGRDLGRAPLFTDRRDAGRQLAVVLDCYRQEHPVVLGLPPGGVPVAAVVARELDAPLDVALVRAIGMPGEAEVSLGAIGEGGVRVVDAALCRLTGVGDAELAVVESRERVELDRRRRVYRSACPCVPVAGRTVVIVDDGIATGSTVRAACQVATQRGADRVVVAVPVAPRESLDALEDVADVVVCVCSPEPFSTAGSYYADFSPTGDWEVVGALRDAATRRRVLGNG